MTKLSCKIFSKYESNLGRLVTTLRGKALEVKTLNRLDFTGHTQTVSFAVRLGFFSQHLKKHNRYREHNEWGTAKVGDDVSDHERRSKTGLRWPTGRAGRHNQLQTSRRQQSEALWFNGRRGEAVRCGKTKARSLSLSRTDTHTQFKLLYFPPFFLARDVFGGFLLWPSLAQMAFRAPR